MLFDMFKYIAARFFLVTTPSPSSHMDYPPLYGVQALRSICLFLAKRSKPWLGFVEIKVIVLSFFLTKKKITLVTRSCFATLSPPCHCERPVDSRISQGYLFKEYPRF